MGIGHILHRINAHLQQNKFKLNQLIIHLTYELYEI